MSVLVTDLSMTTTSDGPSWTVTVLRTARPTAVLGAAPTAADVPDDIRAALRAWLVTNPS